MKITVNNEIQNYDESVSLTKLLAKNNVENPDMVAVQVNGEFVNKDDFASVNLAENDVVDFLFFMGGGSI